MLSVLPIIPSRNSHNFYPLFLFYSHVITYYPCYILNFCVSDNDFHSMFSSWQTMCVIKIDITKNTA